MTATATEITNVSVTDATDSGTEVQDLINANASQEVVDEAIRRAKPWGRVAEAASFTVPQIKDHTPAYTRARTKTVMYRANDKSGWLVVDTRNMNMWTRETTAEARQVTNDLEAELRKQIADQRADAAQAKAANKLAKDEARAAARAAKAQGVADRKAAREAAKAAKDADQS